MWTAAELHEELALYYRQFRGITVTNSFTESLWAKIEDQERTEAKAA